MGSFHQCRLSFMRQLLRRLRSENWSYERVRFDFDAAGVGTALYSFHGPARTYTLVAFGHDLPAEQRSDRVIATAWDATFTLFDGIPDDTDLERLRTNVPLQEAGRISESELTLARANRSVRLWDHVVEALGSGQQPDPERCDAVGYLMRTTAVYGSAKFGAADRSTIADRPEMAPPFQAEMLTVFLIRAFALDLVEHMAARRSDQAVVLEPAVRRRFGVGNSTGLGMAPFLINHPLLINNWVLARERALARVRAVERATPDQSRHFESVLARACRIADEWSTEHRLQQAKLAALQQDLVRLQAHLSDIDLAARHAWDQLIVWSETDLSLEGQELLVSLVLEPYGELVDELGAGMHADEDAAFDIDGTRSVDQTIVAVNDVYRWSAGIDWDSAETTARVWYVSEEKLEPRLGERDEEPLADYEQPLQPARDAHRLLAALELWPDRGDLVANFLMRHPEHRHTVRRLQIVQHARYGEICDNTIAADALPIDLLRAKLSFFGATRFDPRSDRWVRINMYAGAPFPHELAELDADSWTYPAVPSV